MANTVAFGGLRLYRQSEPQPLVKCIHIAGDSVALGVGDAVVINTTAATNIGAGPTVMAVKRATTSGAIYGVVVGAEAITEGNGPINLGIKYVPASTAQYVNVRPAVEGDLYVLQDDGSAVLGIACIGQNGNLVVNNCDTATGMSKMYLNASTVATGNATYQLEVMGQLDDPSNDPTLTSAKWIVRINNRQVSGGTGTVGV